MTNSPDLQKPQFKETEPNIGLRIKYGLSRFAISENAKNILHTVKEKPDWLTEKEIFSLYGLLRSFGGYLTVSNEDFPDIDLTVPQKSVIKVNDRLAIEVPSQTFYANIAKNVDTYIRNQQSERKPLSDRDFINHRENIARGLNFLANQDHVLTIELDQINENNSFSINSINVKKK